MKTIQIILLTIFVNTGTSTLQCWSCFGSQCERSEYWVREFCPEDEKVCYKFEKKDGVVYKMGCAFGDCMGAPGFKAGIKCTSCGYDVCNAGIYNPSNQQQSGERNSKATGGASGGTNQMGGGNTGGGYNWDRNTGEHQGGWAAWGKQEGRQPVGDAYGQYDLDSDDYYSGGFDRKDSRKRKFGGGSGALNIATSVPVLVITVTLTKLFI